MNIEKVNFKDLGMEGNSIHKFEVAGNIFTCNYDKEPNYTQDGALSYFNLVDENEEETNYIIAFDRYENVNEEYVSEWNDEYDVDTLQVYKIK